MFLFIAFFLLLTSIGISYGTYRILRLYFKFFRLKKYGLRTKGSIKQIEIVEGKHGNSYFPVVKFRTYSGIEVFSRPLINFDQSDFYNSRESVEVVYLDSNPKDFIIVGQEFKNFLLFLIPVMFGFGFYIYNSFTEVRPNWLDETIQYFKTF